MDLVLTDPPYNIRREQNRPNSSHDVLSKQDMVKFVDLVDGTLVRGGHAVVYCSFLQFHQWFKAFSSVTEEETEHDAVDPEITKTVEKQVFTIEQKPLTFTRARGNYTSNPAGRRLTHMSMTEIAIHVWRNGLPGQEMLDRVNYNVGQYVPSTLPGWTCTTDNIPRLTAVEKVYSDTRGENNRRLLLRPEQKTLASLKTTIDKYSQPGGLVMDQFAGWFSTARACMLLPRHRRSV